MRLDVHWVHIDRPYHPRWASLSEFSATSDLQHATTSDILFPNRCLYASYCVTSLNENRQRIRPRRSASARPDPSLLVWDDFKSYVRSQSLPWSRDESGVRYARVVPQDSLSSGFLPPLPVRCGDVTLTSQQFSNALQARFAKELVHHACADLNESAPDLSAQAGVTARQRLVLLLLAFSGLACFVLWPGAAYLSLTLLFYAFCVSFFVLRILCLAVSRNGRHGVPATERFTRTLSDSELPIYSILIPLYKEGHMLPRILDAIDALDYPRNKLDVKLILEADDVATLGAVRAVTLDHRFDVIRVPCSLPRTKPKACNFALPFARGTYVVIFDAEDRPEPDQLRKAASMFAALPEDVVCQQARLAYYNAKENWLTRQFAVEYAVWFGLILPGLYALGLIIPLGGTSNHFRTDALRRLKAWDAYNVTEDADLGVRIAACGLRTVMLPSTTYEEANCVTGNWVRQRSRWQKGYLQTWLVHTRQPVHSVKRMGVRKFAGLTLTLLGSVLLGLGPVIGVAIGVGAAAVVTTTDTFAVPTWLTGLSVVLALLGYAVAAVSGWIGLRRTGQQGLSCSLVTVPFYWVLVCFGTLKGACQIITRPFHWEKTEHGLSMEMALPAAPTRGVSCGPAVAAKNANPARCLSTSRR